MCSPKQRGRGGALGVVLTVDRNGAALAENVAIIALKRRDLAQPVQLAVVFINTLGRLGVHKIEFNVVSLGDGEEGGRAWVALSQYQQQLQRYHRL